MPNTTHSPLITHKSQLIDYLASGAKPQNQWRIGTEHEKFVFDRHTLSRAGYEGEQGIRALLDGMADEGNTPINEQGNIIGWQLRNGESVTLEPGGQFELSGAPLHNIHQTCEETNTHLETLRPICQRLGLTMIGIGHDPISTRDNISWMPKGRYNIMRQYMPTKGNLGIDMMIRTCTIQVNLDYSDEQDMREKMRIAAAFQPIATALFANSPFRELECTPYQSLRAACWRDTDPDRTGIPVAVFDRHFGYEQWVDYALSVPMYFLYDNGIYHDVAGADFRDFMAGRYSGKLAKFQHRQATMQDWEDHLTVAFPEVRLKKFIEMRGADGGRWDDLTALPALWVGLLYDAEAQAEALALAQRWSITDIQSLYSQVPHQGLHAELEHKPLFYWADKIVQIAQSGLQRRGCTNALGQDESIYVQHLLLTAQKQQSQADRLVEDYSKAQKSNQWSAQDRTSRARWLLDRLRN